MNINKPIDAMTDAEVEVSLKNVLNTKPVNELKDEEIEAINESLNKVLDASDELKEIAKLPSNNGVETATKHELENETAEVDVNINPITGEHSVIGPAKEDDRSELEKDFITDTFEDLVNNAKSDKVEDIELPDEILIKSAQEQFGNINNAEIIDFINLVKEYKNGNTSNVYGRLPSSIKSIIDNMAMAANPGNIPINPKMVKDIKKQCAKDIIESFISDVSYDTIVVDFQKEWNKVFEDANKELNKLYPESIEDKLKSLQESYDNIINNEESTEEQKEKAKLLLDMKEALEESFTYKKFKEALPSIKIKRFDLEKPKKLYNAFDYKYTNSAYTIHSVSLLYPILNRLFGNDYPAEIIMRFILSFCKYCSPMKPSNVCEHIFMYYFISNIIFLNTATLDESSQFETKLLDSIDECLSSFTIKEV